MLHQNSFHSFSGMLKHKFYEHSKVNSFSRILQEGVDQYFFARQGQAEKISSSFKNLKLALNVSFTVSYSNFKIWRPCRFPEWKRCNAVASYEITLCFWWKRWNKSRFKLNLKSRSSATSNLLCLFPLGPNTIKNILLLLLVL